MLTALFVALSLSLVVTQASCQLPSVQTIQSNPQAALPQINSNQVAIGASVVNVFNFEYTKGDYTIDTYLYFFWTNPDISTIDWNFANGYPITPTSITLIQNTTSGNIKGEVYRAQARLTSAPDASNFPFDTINITISIDVLNRGNNLTLFWLTNQTGIEPQFNNPGWKTDGFELTSTIHTYSLGVQVPRAEMVISQSKLRASTEFAPFIPPLIFSLVSAVSFLFGLREPGAVALRIGLNTSMLVTTLLFIFSVSNGIPPASNVVLYSIFILAVLIFMVCNLIVTVVGTVGWAKYKNERRTKLANQLGLVVSIIVPIVFFIVIYLLRP